MATSPLNNFSLEADFFKVNPQLEVVRAFTDLKKKFSNYSDVLWAIALVYDYTSKFTNLEEHERVLVVEGDLLGEKGFFKKHSSSLKGAIDAYARMQQDSEQRYLKAWSDKVDEIAKVLKETEVDMDNMEAITKMLLLQEKLMEQKDKIEERQQRKEAASRVKGNASISLLESGDI